MPAFRAQEVPETLVHGRRKSTPVIARIIVQERCLSTGKARLVRKGERAGGGMDAFALNWQLATILMRVQVLLFGMLKDLAGRSCEWVDLRDGGLVRDLLEHYRSAVPQMREAMASLAVAVNQQYAGPETVLKADDEVALLPPVSGGAGKAWIVREAIDTQSVLDRIKRDEDGAAVVFEGVVRNQTRGRRRTLYLDYEAYEEMALGQMEDLAEQAVKQFQVRDVALVHRLGRLEIGETSVLIVVASAHRAAAFDACRWLIDTLKRTVPIWKKEYFEDGAVWADGEAFPEEFRRVQGSPGSEDASK
jgi:molybdopterin synthase catalytic subunit/molybdopterin converting factor small subunit